MRRCRATMRMAARTRSIAVVKKLAARKDWGNLVCGRPGTNSISRQSRCRPSEREPVRLWHRNLGGNAIAHYLLANEVNVHFAFADTVEDRRFFIDTDLAPSSCDVLAISVPFEDTYLSVLRLLSRTGMPLLAADRDDTVPLVVGGGMAMINPLPLQDCFDVLVIGEGREALLELTRRWIAARAAGHSRDAALEEMVEIPGVYVPSHYSIELDPGGYVAGFECRNGRETVIANVPLDIVRTPSAPCGRVGMRATNRMTISA